MAESKERIGKHVLLVFCIALGGYAALFSCDNFVRQRKGPWSVEFGSSNGVPFIAVAQSSLGLTNVTILFEGETISNRSGLVLFDRPRQPIPFGETKFEDLTFLPGSVAFSFFGHEVELLPRTLIINKQEKGWASGASYRLRESEKLRPEQFFDPRAKRRKQ